MRSKFALILLIAFFSVPALAQDAINVANHNSIGFPQNGVFNGSDFDTVQLNNGNLHIEIPLWSLPGRGPSAYLKMVYDSKSWGSHEHCHTSVITGDETCNLNIRQASGGHYILGFAAPLFNSTATHSHNGLCGDNGFYLSNYVIGDSSGAGHHLVPDEYPPATRGFNGTALSCPWTTQAQ